MQARQSFILGLAAIVMLLGLSLLLSVFGSNMLGRRGWPLTILTNNAAGLSPGGVVLLNGVNIGSIDEVSLNQGGDPEFPVRVTLLIDEGMEIRRPAKFEIDEPLIGGSSTLNILDGNGLPLAMDGTATLEGFYVSQFDKVGELMTSKFGPVLEAMEAFKQFSVTYAELGEELKLLLAPQNPGTLDPRNLRTAVDRVNGLIAELTDSVRLASEWLNDETFRTGLTDATNEAGVFFAEATEAARRFNALADGLQADAHQLTEQALPVLDRAAVTLEELQRVATSAREGDGTLAQVLNNPDLYNSLEDAATELQQTAKDLQLLIQKWKAEGVPLKF